MTVGGHQALIAVRKGAGMQDSDAGELWVYPLKLGWTVADQDWFPLHFHALLGSRFVARACFGGIDGRAAGFTAIRLWCEAFKQDPAGTLPEDDVELAQLAGFGPDVAAWQAMRTAALYGWTPCIVEGEDGRDATRIGHRVVAEQAVFAWNRKWGRKRGREARRLSDVKWKVRQQMTKAKRPGRLVDDDMLVTRIAEWLIRGGLTVTSENVASALADAGVPSLVQVSRGGDGKV